LSELAKRVRSTLRAWENDRRNPAPMNNSSLVNWYIHKTRRQFRRQRQAKLLGQHKYKPKAFWDFIKGLCSAKPSIPNTVTSENGVNVNEP